MMERRPKFLEVFIKLGKTVQRDSDYVLVEEFICLLCVFGRLADIKVIIHLHKTLHRQETIADSIKNLDPLVFVPCRRILKQHVKAFRYIAKLL